MIKKCVRGTVTDDLLLTKTSLQGVKKVSSFFTQNSRVRMEANRPLEICLRGPLSVWTPSVASRLCHVSSKSAGGPWGHVGQAKWPQTTFTMGVINVGAESLRINLGKEKLAVFGAHLSTLQAGPPIETMYFLCKLSDNNNQKRDILIASKSGVHVYVRTHLNTCQSALLI